MMLRRATTILLLVIIALATADVFMVVQYDSTGLLPTANVLNVTFTTVDLIVTLLGCDDGYYEGAAASGHLTCTACDCAAVPSSSSKRVEPFFLVD
jgi:hypothetical protein